MFESYTASIPEISPTASALLSGKTINATTPVIVSAGEGEYSTHEYTFFKALHDGALNPAFIAARELRPERFTRDAEGFVKASIDPIQNYRDHIASEYQEVTEAFADALKTDPKVVAASINRASKLFEIISKQNHVEKIRMLFGLSNQDYAGLREFLSLMGLPPDVVERRDEQFAVGNVASKIIAQRPRDFTAKPSLSDPVPFDLNMSAAEKEATDYIEALPNRRTLLQRKKSILTASIQMIAAAANMLPTNVAETVLK